MTIAVSTTCSSWISCPADFINNGMTGITFSGYTGLVSLGIQTDGYQDEFAIVQNFASEDGTSGFVQVTNTSNSDTNFAWYATTISDGSSAARSVGEVTVTNNAIKKQTGSADG